MTSEPTLREATEALHAAASEMWPDGYHSGHLERLRRAITAYDALSRANAAAEQEPIDMLLFCPFCGKQHIDEPDERTPNWKNPPHKSHLCHFCKTIWRPSDAPTNGVAAIKTRGKADNWDHAPNTAADVAVPMKLHFTAEQIKRGIENDHDDAEYEAGASHWEAPKQRFFVEHGIVHDRKTGKHVRGCDCVTLDGTAEETCALLNSLASYKANAAADVAVPRRFRHKKRGTTYTVIGQAQVQCPADSPLTEYEVVTVYRAEVDAIDDESGLWVRRKSEFEDGRFEALAAPPKEGE